MVISLIVLATILIRLAMFGVPAPEADEGTGAHLFQLWIVLEVLMVAFYAIKWLPQTPKKALLILAIQIVAALLPMAIVFSLKL